MAVQFTALTLPVIMARATSLYAPSVYNGSGQETKVNLVLSVSDAMRAQIAAIETQLDLGPTSCSVLKSGSLKVKLHLDRTMNSMKSSSPRLRSSLVQRLRSAWSSAELGKQRAARA